MGLPDKQVSFSSLIEALGRGGVEARKRLVHIAHLRPKIVLPYARELAALLDSSRAPVRSASIEMLAVLSRVSPGTMAFLIPRLHDLLSEEPQNAIANHAIEILQNYARTSAAATSKVLPILRSNITKLKPKAAERISKVIEELSK
jgi:hypothetical protein